jgi:phage-related protein
MPTPKTIRRRPKARPKVTSKRTTRVKTPARAVGLKEVSFQWSRGVPLNKRIAPIKAAELSKKIQFKSSPDINKSLRTLKIKEYHIVPVMDQIYKRSSPNALKFAKAILRRNQPDKQTEKESRELVLWAIGKKSTDRQLVVKAFKQSKKSIIMVHAISQMKRGRANAYMKDYFKAGGDMKSIMEWLEIAGGVMSKNQGKPRGTAKKVVKFIKDVVEDVVDAASDMVNAVINAVKSAGKALAKIVSTVVNWTVGKIKNIVHALLEAGQKVVNILAEAAKKGLAVLGKFVQGVIKAGQAIRQVLSWAANKALSVIKSVAAAIIKAGRTVAQIMTDAIKLAFNTMRKVVQALIQMGKKLIEIIASAARWAISRVINLVKALIAVGKKVANILADAVKKGLAVLAKFVQAVIRAGRAITEVIAWAVRKSFSIIKSAVSAILQAGRTLAHIMANAVRMAANALKKVVQALYKLGKKVADILRTVVTRGLSIIRTTLEGLFAIGMQLVKAVGAIFKDIAAGFRKGFLQGLLAIVKSPLKILKAAAKAAGSVIGLAFAAFMELWGGHRSLTSVERREARRVFGWAINLSRVKIATASIPSDVINWINGGRPFTTMYIINFKSGTRIRMNTLIHELTHVWQAVTAGPVYMVEALHSQIFGRGYNVTQADLDKAGGDIRKLEREQQATVIEWYWQKRWGTGGRFDEATLRTYWQDVYKPRPRTIRYNAAIPVMGRIQPLRFRVATP